MAISIYYLPGHGGQISTGLGEGLQVLGNEFNLFCEPELPETPNRFPAGHVKATT
jgi:hypothetical protein